MRKSNKKGFTLVELLVVIAIIAIIAAVAVPVTIGQVNKAKIKTAEREIMSAISVAEQVITDKEAGTATGTTADLIKAGLPNPEYVDTVQIVATSSDPAKIVITLQTDPGVNEELLTKVLSYTVSSTTAGTADYTP